MVTLRIADRCSLARGDFFDYEFDQGGYDFALVAFFLSHLTEAQEPMLFGALRNMLDSSGRFLILDSAWSGERARFNAKSERQERRLNDGTRFEVYKRYCSQEDIAGWATDQADFGTALVSFYRAMAECASFRSL